MKKCIYALFMFALLFTWQQARARDTHVLHSADFTKIEQTKVPVAQNQGFSFNVTEVNVDVTKGETFVPPVLNNPDNLEVTYKTSNPEILYYDINYNQFDVIGNGSCVVTATASNGEVASYTVNINDPSVIHSAGFAYDLQGYIGENEYTQLPWHHSDLYGAAMCAVGPAMGGYINYLISPTFKLSEKGNTLTIKHGWNNLTPTHEIIYSKVVIREVGGPWTVIESPKYIITGKFMTRELMIPNEYNGKDVEIALRFYGLGVVDNNIWVVKHLSVREDARKDPEISFNTNEINIEASVGDEYVPQVLNNPNNLDITYTVGNPDIVYYDINTKKYNILGTGFVNFNPPFGNTTFTATSAATNEYKSKTVSYSLNIVYKDAYYSVGFVDDLRGFRSESTAGTKDWYLDDRFNCAMIGVNKNVSGKYDEYLISPYKHYVREGCTMMLYSNFVNNNGCDIKSKVVIREVGGEWTDLDIPFIYDGQPHHYNNIKIPNQFNNKNIEIAFRFTADPSTDDYIWAVHSLSLGNFVLPDPDFKFEETEVNFDATKGEEFVPPVLNNPNKHNVTYSSTNPDVAYYDNYQQKWRIIGHGTTNLVAYYKSSKKYSEKKVECTLNVNNPSVIYSEGFVGKATEFKCDYFNDKYGWSNCGSYYECGNNLYSDNNAYTELFMTSPEITLSDGENFISTFCQFTGEEKNINAQIIVREVGGEWVKLEVPFIFDNESHYYESIKIPDSFNGKKVQIAYKYVREENTKYYTWKVFSISIRKDYKPSSGIAFDKTEVNFDATKGDEFVLPVLNNPNNLEVTYRTNKPGVIYYDVNDKVFEIIGNGTCTISARNESTFNYRESYAACTVNVIDPSVVFSAGFANDLQGARPEYDSWRRGYWDYSSTYGATIASVDESAEVYNNYFVSPEFILGEDGNNISIKQAFTNRTGKKINSRIVIREVGGEWNDIPMPTYIEDGKFHYYENIIIPDKFNGKKVELALLFTADGNTEDYTWAVKHITVRTLLRPDPQISFDVTEVNYDPAKGEPLVVPTLNNPNNVSVDYTSSNPDVVYYDKDRGNFYAVGNGSSVITATSAETEQYRESTASYTVNVSDSTVVYSVGFGDGMRGFRQECSVPEKNDWYWNSGANCAFIMTDQSYSGVYDNYLISPEIALSNNRNIISLYSNIGNYTSNEISSKMLVREVGGEWNVLDVPFSGDGQPHSYDGIMIPDSLNGKKVEIAFRYTADGTADNYFWAVHTMTVREDLRQDPQISFDVTEVNYDPAKGEPFVAPTLNNPNNVEVTYSSSNPDVVYYDKNYNEYYFIGSGTTVITATSAATEQYRESSASYTLNVSDSTVVYSAGFADDLHGFRQESSIPDKSDWRVEESTNSAYIETDKNVSGVYDNYLISPEITLGNKRNTISLYSNICNYTENEILSRVVIREAGGEWNVIDVPFIIDGQPHNYEGILIPDSLSGKKVEIGFRYTADGTADNYYWEVHTMTVREVPKPVSGISFDVTEVNYDPAKGEPFVVPALNNPNNVGVDYTSSNPDVVYYDKDRGNFYAVGNGSSVITATSAETEQYCESSASYTVNVSDSTVVYSVGFGDGMRGFRQECSVPDKNDWYWNSDANCAFIMTDQNYSGVYDDYLISPEITLSSKGNLISLFTNFGNYTSNEISSKMLVREVGGEWNVLDVPFTGDGYPHSYDGIMIPDQFNGKKVEIGFRYTADGTSDCYYWAVHTMTVRAYSKQDADLSFDVTEVNYDVNSGEQFVAPTLNNPNNLAVTYESSNPDVAYFLAGSDYMVVIGNGTTEITVRSAADEKFAEGVATYTLNVTDNTSVYSVSFVQDNGGFNTDDTVSTAWVWDGDNHCMTAYAAGMVAEMTDFYLYSPEITLSEIGNTAEILHGFIGVKDLQNQAQLLIRETGGDWVKLDIPSYGDESSYNFSGKILIPSQFNGKKVQMAFKFATDGQNPELWYVTHLKVNSCKPADISFDVAEVNYEMGSGDFVAPILNNPNNLSVTYYSDNSMVAEVDEYGNVNIVGDGTAVITATSAATNMFGEGTASYVLVVTDPDIVYSADFLRGDCGFGTEGDTDAYVWTLTQGQNFIMANGEGVVSEMGDYYCISPAFTLDGNGNMISFYHYASNMTDMKNQAQLVIREIGGSWSTIEIANYPDGEYWVLSGNIEIPAIYNGKDVQIGFKHTTNGSDYSGLWAVGLVKVKKFVPTSIGNAEVDILNGKLFDLQGRRVDVPGNGVYIKDGKKFVFRKK